MVAPLKVGIAGLGTVGVKWSALSSRANPVGAQRRNVRVSVTARSKVKKRSLDLRGIEWAKARWRSPPIPVSIVSSN